MDVVVALASGKAHSTVPEADSSATTATTNGHGHGHGRSTNGEAVVVGGGPEPLFNNLDVRIPKEVVDQGVKALKDSIRPIATIEGDEDTAAAETDDNNSKGTEPKSEKKPSKASTKDSRLKTAATDASPSKNAASKDKKAKSGGK